MSANLTMNFNEVLRSTSPLTIALQFEGSGLGKLFQSIVNNLAKRSLRGGGGRLASSEYLVALLLPATAVPTENRKQIR